MDKKEEIELPGFGKSLKQFREVCMLTLRQVEEITGISNAYLSQLESGKIKKPSVNVIYKLSQLYKVDIDELLHLAGFVTDYQHKHWKVFTAELSAMQITRHEEQKLIEYLQFLRSPSQRIKQKTNDN